MVIYELITLNFPFDGETIFEIQKKIIEEEIPQLPNSNQLNELVKL